MAKGIIAVLALIIMAQTFNTFELSSELDRVTENYLTCDKALSEHSQKIQLQALALEKQTDLAKQAARNQVNFVLNKQTAPSKDAEDLNQWLQSNFPSEPTEGRP